MIKIEAENFGGNMFLCSKFPVFISLAKERNIL